MAKTQKAPLRSIRRYDNRKLLAMYYGFRALVHEIVQSKTFQTK